MTPYERARQIDAEEFKRDSKRALDRALAYSKQKQDERRRQFLTFAFGEEGNTLALDKLHAPTELDRSPVTFYTFGKQTFSVAQWAQRLGVEPDTLLRHARDHGSMEAGLAFCLKHRRKRTGKPPALIEYQGLKLTRHQWAKRLGIAVATLDSRRKRYGIDAAIAMGGPERQGRHLKNYNPERITFDGLALTRQEWAEHLGIAYTSFCGRIARLGVETAIAMGGPTPRGYRSRPANDNAPGVVSDFVPVKGTGAGAVAQETPKITFSDRAKP